MNYFNQFINDLLTEVSYRTKEGIVDLKKSEHLAILSEVLDELGLWEIKSELFQNLFEAETFVAIKKDTGEPAVFKSKEARDNAIEAGTHTEKEEDEEGDETKKTKSSVNPTTAGGQDYLQNQPDGDVAKQQAIAKGLIDGNSENDNEDDSEEAPATPIEMEELSNEQQKTSELRDKGEAGAGGMAASQGESRYCNAVDNLDYNEFGKNNRKEIDAKIEKLKSKNKLSADETEVLGELGFEIGEDGKYSNEAYDYLATRELWAEQELARMTDPNNQPNVFTSKDGFDKSEKAYLDWMRAAFDGALATKELLKESRMDTTKPMKAVQSTTEIDDRVEATLLQKLNDPNLSEEDKLHYESELKSFRKFRKYHDTYVIGQDEKGRTFIVSVSNKKSSKLDDPQNNTTPNARFQQMKSDFGEQVAKRVTLSINDGIRAVTNVQNTTRVSSTKVEIDDDFAALAEAASPKRVKEISNRANKRNRVGSGDRKGLPKPGHEFGCWLDDNNISSEEWENLGSTERLKLMQKYMGDDEWQVKNKTQGIAYDPYSKIFIKVGEAMKGGRGFGTAFWKKHPRAEAAKESNGAKQCEEIKTTEQTTVKQSHQRVVNEVTEADKEMGYPKDGKNGPHTQAYVGTVMQAMHFDSYIDLSDEDDDKMIVQMGIVGAKPSNIRECLAKQSGYEMPPGDRNGLKKHLRETCSIEAGTGAIIIKSKDNKGEPTKIANDTWRTAGTSQKVASGFGEDMRECVKTKVKSQRQSPIG